MTTIKTEGFAYPMQPQRPDFRRPFSDGSMTIATSDLTASLSGAYIPPFSYEQQQPLLHHHHQQALPSHQPFLQSFSYPTQATQPIQVEQHRSRSLSRPGQTGKAPRSRSGRKGSMTDVRPAVPRARTASNRAMSYSHPDGRMMLQTHLEGGRTNSVSPPDYAFNAWNGSMPSMQSFGTTVDEAILDSPISPSSHLPPLHDIDEEMKKQRRRDCHNQVEKRRREHINTKIEELSGLLPPQYQQVEEEDEEEEEAAGAGGSKKKNRRNSMAKQKDLAHCKGRILTHSVQYIHDLRHVNELQATRIMQLESLLNLASPAMQQPTSLFYDQTQGLEAMRPSPEPEQYIIQPGPTWEPFNPVFEPSPEGYHNSASSGSSAPPEHALPDLNRPTHTRQESQLELQMSMNGMDLDSVFASRREEEHPMRWH